VPSVENENCEVPIVLRVTALALSEWRLPPHARPIMDFAHAPQLDRFHRLHQPHDLPHMSPTINGCLHVTIILLGHCCFYNSSFCTSIRTVG
jgi:hypothetical protein